MKKLTYNKTILLFLSINDMITLKNGELKKIKDEYLNTYDNCIIYNYYELKHHKKLIKDKINKLCFVNQTRINARDCKITHISKDDKNQFLNENHIQGTDKSQFFYGAYHSNNLIAILTFDNKKMLNGGISDGEYDLSRFSIKIGYIAVGLFNKMLKQFVLDYSPKKIISFADLNLVNRDNNIYISNGFKVSKNIPPDYKFYVKCYDNIYHKFTFGNRFMKNQNISLEEKNRIQNEITKVWNCGKLKYIIEYDNENNKIFGYVYMIKNMVNNKMYIGQTIRTLNKRIYEYKSALNKNLLYNPHLLNAFNKHGWDNFEFSIVDSAISMESLNEKEIFYINKYNTTDKNIGYNIEVGGRNSSPTTETLEKMSRSHIGIKQSSSWINRRIAISGSDDAKKYGKRKTEEEKKLLSLNSPKYWEGKTRDAETREKISRTKKALGISEKQKEVLCKKVYKYNTEDGKLLDTYDSTLIASKAENVNQSTISRWCKNNKNMNNITWSYS